MIRALLLPICLMLATLSFPAASALPIAECRDVQYSLYEPSDGSFQRPAGLDLDDMVVTVWIEEAEATQRGLAISASLRCFAGETAQRAECTLDKLTAFEPSGHDIPEPVRSFSFIEEHLLRELGLDETVRDLLGSEDEPPKIVDEIRGCWSGPSGIPPVGFPRP